MPFYQGYFGCCIPVNQAYLPLAARLRDRHDHLGQGQASENHSILLLSPAVTAVPDKPTKAAARLAASKTQLTKGTTMQVICLTSQRVDRGLSDRRGKLPQHQVDAVFDELCAKLAVRFRRAQHRHKLRTLSYGSLGEIEQSLRRYKVFGDLAPKAQDPVPRQGRGSHADKLATLVFLPRCQREPPRP